MHSGWRPPPLAGNRPCSWLPECMGIRRASRYQSEAIAVNFILAISNSISELSPASSGAQTDSVQRGAGGFASTLAAAQELSTASRTAAGEAEASDGPVVGSAGAATSLNVRPLAAGNLQFKRLLSSPDGLSTTAAVNVGARGFIAATASQIPSPPLPRNILQLNLLQPNLSQPSLVQPNLVQANLVQASVSPTLPAVASAQAPEVVSVTVQAGLQANPYEVTTPGTPVYSTPSPSAGILSSFTTSDSTAGGLTNPNSSTPAVLIPNVRGQENGQQTVAAQPNPEPGSRWDISQEGSGSAGATLPESMQSSVLSDTTGQPVSDKVSLNATPGSQWNGEHENGSAEPMVLAENVQPSLLSTTNGQTALNSLSADVVKNSQGSASLNDGPALGPEDPTLQADQAFGQTAFASTFLANANNEAGPVGALMASAEPFGANVSGANPPSGQASAADAGAPETAVQTDLSAQTGTENPLSAIMNGLISAPANLNAAAQLGPGKALLRFTAARVADAITTPNIRGVGLGAGAPGPIPGSVLSTEADSGKGLPLASQTPFAVFFSGPGPGTESAASALPKMILPVTSSAIRDSHTASIETSSTSPQTGGLQSDLTRNAASQITKDSSAGSLSGSLSGSLAGSLSGSSSGYTGGSLPAGQPPRREGDLSAASAQFAASQTATALTAAPLLSAAVALPLGGPAALVADSTPQTGTGTVPGSGPNGPSNMIPTAPETLPAAIPGPVQLAQLVNRVEQSEMRIGMNTSAFGSVEVRTVVHANDVGLVIGSEKGDLRGFLTNDMPAIANTLQEQNLRLHTVNFMQGFAFSNNASGGGDSQARSFVPMRAASNAGLSEAAVDDSRELLPAREFAGGGLSILA
jgi:hypothetical protein